MKLIHIILIGIGVILTSFYIFPVQIGPANTKLLMAIMGALIFIVRGVTRGFGGIDKNLIIVFVLGLGVSLSSFLAIIINGTNDTTYVTYFWSMIVWLFGAYCLVAYLDMVHGRVDIRILGVYLVIMGAMQGILALLIDNYPSVENFLVRIHLLNQYDINYARQVDRLFGVGCCYDPAGIRLGGILIVAFYLYTYIFDNFNKWICLLYILSIFVIEIVGNMISRTTNVGFTIGILYFLYASGVFSLSIAPTYKKSLKWISSSMVVAVIFVGALYTTNSTFKKQFRFGFEGFVSLVETGEWNTTSTNQLKTMYRFPQSLHTWIIGDGYIDTTDNDPYYTGVRYKGYYKAIDVGYLRFIYYGGITMLFSFIAYFLAVTYCCSSSFPKYKLLFVALFALQLVVWLKVATDVFCVFACFLALSMLKYNNNTESKVELKSTSEE